MRRFATISLVLAACSGGGATDDTTPGTDTGELTFPDVPLTEPYTSIAPVFSWEEVQILGDRYKYVYHVPEGATGIVWAFHGGFGGLQSVQQTEWIVIYNQLVQRGIGIVLTESIDRKQGDWVDEDEDRTVEIFDDMVANDVVPADIPQGFLGFSGGSDMARRMVERGDSEGWTVRAAALHQGGQLITSVPTMYIASENDETGRVAEFYTKRSYVEQCTEVAGDCRLREGEEIPLDPLRMARLPGVTQERAPDFFDDLLRIQFIDAEGNRRVEFDTDESVEFHIDRYLQLSRMGARAFDAASQLRVVWATHRLSSEFVQEEANFFWIYLR